MMEFTLYTDSFLEQKGAYLEVPTELVVELMNNATNSDTRVSSDDSLVYLAAPDHEPFTDRLRHRGIKYEVTEKHVKGPSFIRDLSPLGWQ